MKQEVELQLKIKKPQEIEKKLKKIGKYVGTRKQIDKYFVPPFHKITVIKTRKYFDFGDFEVTLNRVKDLGDFMEIEANKDFGGLQKTRKACLDFLKTLNIEYEMKRLMGFPRMLYRKLKRKKI